MQAQTLSYERNERSVARSGVIDRRVPFFFGRTTLTALLITTVFDLIGRIGNDLYARL